MIACREMGSIARAPRSGPNVWIAAGLLALGPLALTCQGGGREPLAASAQAAQLDAQIDWTAARLIVVQDGNRYKTLDSFARESFEAMYGREHLPGLSPMASLLEWLFNRDAYLDAPVVRIRDRGLRIHFTAHMPEAQRQRIRRDGYMTPRELSDPAVLQRMEELEPRNEMVNAMRRVRNAQAVAQFLDRLIRIVPARSADRTAPWYTPHQITLNLPEELRRQAGRSDQELMAQYGPPAGDVTSEQATQVLATWAGLRASWLAGDAPGVQRQLDRLARVLEELAGPGVYPQRSQRVAETRYYALGKFTWGYWVYLLGALVSVWALVTRWRGPWVAALVLLVGAVLLHGYGLGLRWYILGRIPNANMWEAITFSSLMGIVAALVVELVWRTRVLLLAAHATGFFALVLADTILPGALTSIMGILDDVMLRIHTVMIIASYSLIFLASVIAVVYLFGYYFVRHPVRSTQTGLVVAGVGVGLWAVAHLAFYTAATASGAQKDPRAAVGFWTLSAILGLALLVLTWTRRGGFVLAVLGALLVGTLTAAIGTRGFVIGMALTLAAGGVLWALLNGAGLLMTRRAVIFASQPRVALAAGGAGGRLELVADGEPDAAAGLSSSSGAGPRRGRSGAAAAGRGSREAAGVRPAGWLDHLDWTHRIILHLVFVLLFGGIVLGAVWADYSWGRPWGWDPKEVFAMNTWIIYAILIHARLVVREQGLWTAWLSVAGCLMMAFNWCFVNFFIVGLHSYA